MPLWATSLQGCVSCPGTVLLQRQLGRWVWNLETQHGKVSAGSDGGHVAG